MNPFSDQTNPDPIEAIGEVEGQLSAFRRDRVSSRRVLRERAAVLARPAEFADDSGQGGRQLIRFRAGESYYGIDLSHLREIRKAEHIAAIPCTPNFILGLIQVHGEITATVDLVDFFGFRRTNRLPTPTTVMVVEVGQARLGIAVDELEEVHPLNENQLKPTPAILSQVEQETTFGVVSDGTVILDAEALATHTKLCVGQRGRAR